MSWRFAWTAAATSSSGRERDRKDRMLGQPGALYDVVHAHLWDDLVVDTSAADPAGCAAQIVHAAGR